MKTKDGTFFQTFRDEFDRITILSSVHHHIDYEFAVVINDAGARELCEPCPVVGYVGADEMVFRGALLRIVHDGQDFPRAWMLTVSR